jgi:hypothetical protein
MATTAIIEKRVNEKFAIGFSYSSPDLAAGETISTVTTTVTTGLTKEGSPIHPAGTNEVSQVVSGGTVGTDYNVVFLVTTSAGYIFEDVYIVKVV